MASEKSTDEDRVTKNSNESGNISVGSGPIQVVNHGGVIVNVHAKRASSNSLRSFIQILNVLLERHQPKQGWLTRLRYALFHPNNDRDRKSRRRAMTKALLRLDKTAQVSNTSELINLLRTLTYNDFYEIAESEKQLRCIRMLLDYLIHNAPQDYQFIVDNFLGAELEQADTTQIDVIADHIMARLVRAPVVPGNAGSIAVGGSVVNNFPLGQKEYDYSERLAGDETTDAPPPEKKKKSR